MTPAMADIKADIVRDAGLPEMPHANAFDCPSSCTFKEYHATASHGPFFEAKLQKKGENLWHACTELEDAPLRDSAFKGRRLHPVQGIAERSDEVPRTLIDTDTKS